MNPPSDRADNPRPAPARWRRRSRLALLLAALLWLALVLPPLALWLTARTEAGTRWLLSQVPGLTTGDIHGALLGERFRVDTLRWRGSAQQPSLSIEQLELVHPQWRVLPNAGVWLGLSLDGLNAARVVWHAPAEPAPAGAPPTQLRLPFALGVQRVRIGTVQFDERVVATDVHARLQVSGRDGAEHRIDELSLRAERATLQGSAHIGADAPLELSLALRAAAAAAGTPWQADASASGTLTRLDARATLRGEAAAPGRAAPSLDIQARIEPFAAWPLAALELATRELDLAALSDAAPATRIDARARIDTRGLDQPVHASVQLANHAPGRLDERRLPLRRLQLELAGTPTERDRLTIERLDAELADERAVAGRLRGSGHWHRTTLTLKLQAQSLFPARIDSRAGAMELSGPLALEVQGLPVPTAERTGPAPPWQAHIEADLSGVIGPRRNPMRADFDARLRAGEVEVTRLLARSGDARLDAKLKLQRAAAAARRGWHLAGAGEITRFDPLPWWPGPSGSAWSRGPHRFDGRFEVDLQWPEDVGERWQRDRDAALAALRGRTRVDLRDSVLAGAPVSGQAEARADDGGLDLEARARVAGNQFDVNGRRAREPAADRWRVDANAPALAALQPVLGLLPADTAASLPGLRGELRAQARASGRWPALATQGELQLRALQWQRSRVDSAQARWQLEPGDGGALALQATLAGWQQGEQRIDALDARIEGTRGEHRLQLRLDTPLRPPAWTESLLGPTAGGTRAALDGVGQWQRVERGGHLWRGEQLALRVGARQGGNGAAWVEARSLKGQLLLDAQGRPQRAELAPGRLALPAGAAWRWSEATWRAGDGGGADRFDLHGELEPLAIAPLLAKLQPEIGWTGDLTLAGRVELRAAERFDADVVVERSSGDLRIVDETGLQTPLGLTDLRLVFAAHDGLWQFAQGAAGRQLGEMAGSQVLRADARARWPSADAPLEGVLQVRVANLGAWGVWVPPGWRLGGNLQVSGALGGRFGAPEVRGSLQGSELSVRNALQGVSLADGELTATLEGAVARVQRFQFKGGDGLLRVTGEASLGATPSARLQLEAEHFRLLGRIDRRLVTTGRAVLDFNRDVLKLDGRFKIDEGLIDFSRGGAPTLDDDVHVTRNGDRRSGAPAGASERAARPLPAALRDAQIALAIDLGDKLQVRGRGLDAGLRGELKLSTPGGRLAVNGTVRTAAGTYVAYAQKMSIERGELAFSGAAENPRLDIIAIRPNLDVRVGVAVTGTLASPRVRLFSEPEMTEMDKLSWLVLGRASEGLGRTDTALLQRAAIALLSGEGQGPTDQLINQLGLSELSLRQSEGEVKETIVSLGRQLSQRWYVGYERSVNATTGTWQLIYRVAQRLTVRAQSGVENSLDVIWSWRWN